MMKLSDLIIIYLAIGAPLGVHFYLTNRNLLATRKLLIKTILAFIFWVPFLFILLRTKKSFTKALAEENPNKPVRQPDIDRKIFFLQKNFEAILKTSRLKLSVFEFREIIERYAGLTLALKNLNPENQPKDEIFQLSGHTNVELAKICLKRRNRKHLSFHQTNARQNFLNIVSQLSDSISGKKKLGELAFEFVKLLNDEEALTALAHLFDKKQQTQTELTVKPAEEETWKPDKRKQLNANHLPIRLRAMPAMGMNLRKKD